MGKRSGSLEEKRERAGVLVGRGNLERESGGKEEGGWGGSRRGSLEGEGVLWGKGRGIEKGSLEEGEGRGSLESGSRSERREGNGRYV